MEFFCQQWPISLTAPVNVKCFLSFLLTVYEVTPENRQSDDTWEGREALKNLYASSIISCMDKGSFWLFKFSVVFVTSTQDKDEMCKL